MNLQHEPKPSRSLSRPLKDPEEALAFVLTSPELYGVKLKGPLNSSETIDFTHQIRQVAIELRYGMDQGIIYPNLSFSTETSQGEKLHIITLEEKDEYAHHFYVFALNENNQVVAHRRSSLKMHEAKSSNPGEKYWSTEGFISTRYRGKGYSIPIEQGTIRFLQAFAEREKLPVKQYVSNNNAEVLQELKLALQGKQAQEDSDLAHRIAAAIEVKEKEQERWQTIYTQKLGFKNLDEARTFFPPNEPSPEKYEMTTMEDIKMALKSMEEV